MFRARSSENAFGESTCYHHLETHHRLQLVCRLLSESRAQSTTTSVVTRPESCRRQASQQLKQRILSSEFSYRFHLVWLRASSKDAATPSQTRPPNSIKRPDINLSRRFNLVPRPARRNFVASQSVFVNVLPVGIKNPDAVPTLKRSWFNLYMPRADGNHSGDDCACESTQEYLYYFHAASARIIVSYPRISSSTPQPNQTPEI